jgi:hypothetical protein
LEISEIARLVSEVKDGGTDLRYGCICKEAEQGLIDFLLLGAEVVFLCWHRRTDQLLAPDRRGLPGADPCSMSKTGPEKTSYH